MTVMAFGFLFVLAAFAQTGTVEFQNDPAAHVVVIVNENAAESVAIGEYYAKARKVKHLLKLKTSTQETISWKEFREQILKPVKNFLEDKPDVIYLVPTWGVPVKTSEENKDNDGKGGDPVAQFVTGRDYCCIDRELELLRIDHDIEGWFANPLFNKDKHITPEDKVYIVCRLDGPTPADVYRMIDNAIYAETYGVEGDHWLDTRGLMSTDQYAAQDQRMKVMLEVFAKHGMKLNHDDTPEVLDLSGLKDLCHYFGWYTGNIVAKGPFAFKPGAVAAHLHSFSAGVLRSKTQTWTGPLIARGATCSFGTVWEPLTDGFPDAPIFFDRFLSGYTFGEAMQMSNIYSSWMAVFVGDPLYAPYARGRGAKQNENRKLALEGVKTLIAALDAGKVDEAYELAQKILALPAPFQGIDMFVIREALARKIAVGKKTTTIADMKKSLETATTLNALDPIFDASPNNFDACIVAAQMCVNNGKFIQALEFVERAKKVVPDAVEVHYWSGLALRGLGKFDDAIAALEKAKTQEAEIAIGLIYLDQKKYGPAAAKLQAAYDRQPDRKLGIALAKAYAGSKDNDKAAKVLDAAFKDLPDTPDEIDEWLQCFDLLSLMLKSKGDVKGAAGVEATKRNLEAFRKPSKAEHDRAVKQLEKLQKLPQEKVGDFPDYRRNTTSGLVELRLANKSDAPMEVLLVGPSVWSGHLPPTKPKQKEKVINTVVFPGIYTIAIKVTVDQVAKVYLHKQKLDVFKSYSISLDDKFKPYLAPTR